MLELRVPPREPTKGMTTMRPIRTLATTLLIASLAAAGCGRGQPDQPTTQPSQPAVVTTAPTPKAPNPTLPTPVPTPRPRVLSITTIPDLPREGGFRQLPPGAGTIVFRVRAVNAQRVRFYLTPTGTAMFNENQLIGQDTNGRDGWSLTWRYPGGGMLAHLSVIAVGATGARSGMPSIGLYQPGPEPAPRIQSVTIPTLPREGGFLRLPTGAGKVIFRVQATHTTKVRFLLSPTGTNTAARLLGEDTNGRDGWTLAWRYPNQPLAADVTVRAIGPGGTSPDSVLGLYHPDPNS
jgi:hypothetical protein